MFYLFAFVGGALALYDVSGFDLSPSGLSFEGFVSCVR